LDALNSTLFYVFAAVAVIGALVAALGRTRTLGALGLLLVALGVALELADLSAGFAGLVVLVLLLGAAALVLAAPAAAEAPFRRADNLGALAAALLFGALAYASYRGLYHWTGYPGGTFNAAALGRLLIGRDALGLIAVGAAALIGIGHLPARRRKAARR
jgi:hypothetical protein